MVCKPAQLGPIGIQMLAGCSYVDVSVWSSTMIVMPSGRPCHRWLTTVVSCFSRFISMASLLKSGTVSPLRITICNDCHVCSKCGWRSHDALVQIIANSGLDVFAHNIETVESRQAHVRDRRANWGQSLAVLAAAKELGTVKVCDHKRNVVAGGRAWGQGTPLKSCVLSRT